MILSNLFEQAPAIEINQLSTDSRLPMHQAMFFCLEGFNFDAHNFIPQAIENGAICIIHSKDIETRVKGIVYIKVNDVAETLNHVAARFYDYPTSKMFVYGITGTNGKSTIANIIKNIHCKFEPCGYIGTISISYNDITLPPDLTTPDTITIQRISKVMVDDGIKALALEVSSHGLELKRVNGVDFDIAIFTNFTYDHLDFHGTLENYLNAKKKLFSMIKAEGTCILNADDPMYKEFLAVSTGKVVTYGITSEAMYRADDIKLGTSGSTFTLIYENNNYFVETNLVALYNIYNLLAAIAALHRRGFDLEEILAYLNHLEQVDGRLEKIDEGQPFNVFVDFAHTPDGLVKVFEYAKLITPEDRHIISVFGSAGKRDTKKRKVFGEIASQYCDTIILTEDDPRDENPADIASEIKEGITNTNHVYLENRYDAIRAAIEMANVDDTVLILGKGDETFIYRENGRDPYCGDHVAAKEIIRKYYLGVEEENHETK